MTFQQLPHEILQNIFRKFDRKRDLLNCAMVCQTWNLPASIVLYEKIDLNNMQQMLLTLEAQQRNNNIYCRVLQFNRRYLNAEDRLPNEDDYQRFLSLLPNLRKIILQRSGQPRTYHLQQIANNAILNTRVQEVKLETPWRTAELQAYFNCIFAFKNTLQVMNITSPGAIIFNAGNIRLGNMVSFLSEFTSLANLSITNSNNPNTTSLPQLCMFLVMRSCPRLNSFEITNDFEQPEMNFFNLNIDHSNLENLDITMPNITAYHTNYMSNYLTHLKRLKLKCGFVQSPSLRDVTAEWIERIGAANMERLQNYMANINEVEFCMGRHLKTSFTSYWPFVTSILTNSPTKPTHISVKINRLDDRNQEHETILKKDLENIYLHCMIDIQNFSLQVNQVTIPVLLRRTMLPETLSEMNIIRSFHVDINTDYRERMVYDLRFAILESAIQSFQHLFDLSINIVTTTDLSFNIRIASKEINDAQVTNISDRLTMVSPRPSATLQNKLAYVRLKNIRILDHVTRVLRLLPNTKYLEISECNFRPDNNFNFTLDLVDLHLERLTLDIRGIVNPRNTFVLKIEKARSNETLIYKCESYTNRIFERVDESYLTNVGRFFSPIVNIVTVDVEILEDIV